MSIGHDEANTGILVGWGLRSLSWKGPRRDTDRTAWSLGGVEVSRSDNVWSIHLGMWPSPGAQLTLVAARCGFVTLNVPSLGPALPDYEDDEASVRAGCRPGIRPLNWWLACAQADGRSP